MNENHINEFLKILYYLPAISTSKLERENVQIDYHLAVVVCISRATHKHLNFKKLMHVRHW